MKRFLRMIIVSMLVFTLMLVMADAVIAETVVPTVTGGIYTPGADEPFTWTYLATIAGATAATLLIVQFAKFKLDRVWKIPTRLVVYVIALLIMLIANAFTGGLTLNGALLAALNAVVVALSAYGAYEVTFRAADAKKSQTENS